MAKKKKINKRLNELFDKNHYEEPKTDPEKKNEDTVRQGEMESVESGTQDAGPEMDESEAQASDLMSSQDEKGVAEPGESVESAVETLAEEEELSPEDLLDEVRHSLIEVEEEKEEKPKWWKRFGRGSRGKEAGVEAPVVSEPAQELETPELVEGGKEDEQEEYVEQIDDLIDMLDSDVDEGPVEVAVADTQADEVKQEQEEVKVVDFAEMKKRAFRAPTPEEDEKISQVRSVALEGGEEIFVEIESGKEDLVEERWKSFENALMPYRSYITFTAIFIGFLAIVAIGYLVYDAYQKSLPPPVIEEVEALPYPTVMYLPGGLSFNLGRGSLKNGRWDPGGPEWLEGTEVCRWVAIPYSRQLEAVVRTLTREDKIELLMSNGDQLSYDVFSITQMTLDEMLALNSNSPCLLLVLADAKTDDRWVVTANP